MKPCHNRGVRYQARAAGVTASQIGDAGAAALSATRWPRNRRMPEMLRSRIRTQGGSHESP